MSCVMPKARFQTWLGKFLPGLLDVEGLLPAEVSDRSDPKIAHLDGWNLSRAWNLLIIANAIDDKRQSVRQVLVEVVAHRRVQV